MPERTKGEHAYAAFARVQQATTGVGRRPTPFAKLHTCTRQGWEAAAQAVLGPAQTDRDAVYHERNMLVAYLATCYPAHLARHPEHEPWDDDWRWLVCVHTPAGQMTWHIHDSEYPLFRWLPAQGNDWDGHTTEEKYTCLLGLIIEKGAQR